MKLATIDIGTNTTLLLVAEGTHAGDVRVLEEAAEITRLGRGIGKDGGLGAQGLERTLEVLRAYAARIQHHGARVHAIGTEALRRAPNAQDFLGPAAAILGSPIEVIDGDREAALTFRAAVTSFPELGPRPFVVIDIGGGSTEVIVAQPGGPGEEPASRSAVSLSLGSVRLTERFVKHDPPQPAEIDAINAELAAQLRDLPARAADGQRFQLCGTAGTVTTLAAMALGLESYDPDRVHGFRLERAALERQLQRLAGANQAERERMAGLDPRRADVIFAGACILQAFVQRLDAPAVLVNDRGIRWGLLYEALAKAAG
jgi:exopolyphosphatase/guanosine-5'-triphosphate,3'-diphosphate pyrophosphatase